jgi:choline-sulfatase
MDRPNVVFIIADQHRWDTIGYEGNGTTYTPHLNRLAGAGTVFRSAYCTSPLCCPSRAAIASGRYGMNSGCFTNLHQLPPGTPSFVEQLRQQGYRTCAIGKTHTEIHAYDSDLTSDAHRAFMDSLGWDEVYEISGNGMLKTGIRCAYSEYLREQGAFDQVLAFYRQWHYFMDQGRKGDASFVCHEWSLPQELQETAWIGNQALAWLQKQPPGRPFFLHIGFAGPHSPIEPAPRFMDLYRDRKEALPWGAKTSPAWLPDGRRGYRAMISQIDEQIGHLYACLAEKGVLDRTIWVYTADHGEMAGDHGRYGKTCFYEPSVRVPLLFAGPGVQAGQHSSALVELLDLGKTLCELCRVPPHALDQGLSLAPILAGKSASHRDTAYCEMGCDKMIRDERYKLMWGEPSSDTRRLGRLHLDKPVDIAPSPPRLYDLQQDPRELHNLANDPNAQVPLAEMMAKLLTRLNQNTQTQPFLDRGRYRPLA